MTGEEKPKARRGRKPGSKNKRIMPDDLAASGTEHGIQAAFFLWLRDQSVVPGFEELALFHAIPNGGERNPIVASRLKAEGAKPGIWDTFLPVPHGGFAGLYIEFKAAVHRTHKNGGLKPEQVAFGLALIGMGYKMEVCYTWEEARTATLAYVSKARTLLIDAETLQATPMTDVPVPPPALPPEAPPPAPVASDPVEVPEQEHAYVPADDYVYDDETVEW